MMGRSSRSRGICQGSLFTVSDERAGKVIERLKLKGVATLQGLEKLIIVMEKKRKDINFVRMMQELKQNQVSIKTFEDLKRNLDDKALDKLMKEVFG